MARLRIEIGGIASEITADNTKAANVLTNVADRRGFEGTNQQKLDQIVALVRDFLTEESRAHAKQQAAVPAGEEAYNDPANQFEE